MAKKREDVMTPYAHFSYDESKVLSDIVGNSKEITLLDYKIGCQIDDIRSLEVSFKVNMTVEDYRRIGQLMVDNVKSKFGQEEVDEKVEVAVKEEDSIECTDDEGVPRKILYKDIVELSFGDVVGADYVHVYMGDDAFNLYGKEKDAFLIWHTARRLERF